MNTIKGESPASQRSHTSSLSLSPPPMPQSNSASSQDHKIVRKRNRLPVSCNFCRQRKLKCNRGHPCENCIKRGEEGGCVYLMGNNGHHATAQAAAAHSGENGAETGNKRASGAELQNRLDKLESLVLGLMHTSAGESDSPQDSANDESVASQNRQPRSTFELAPDVDAVRESLGMMKLDKKGKAMYHGETHWGALLNELSEVKALFEKGKQYFVENGGREKRKQNCAEARNHGFPFNNSKSVDRSELLSMLPSREDCDTLVFRYFAFFDPIYHILHKPSFEEEYSRFWEVPDEIEIAWVGMLFAMLTVSLQSYRDGDAPEAFLGTEVATWLAWQGACETCLVHGKFMLKGSLTIIRTLVLWIMAETRRSLDGNWMDRTWVTVGVIIRIAQSMGLHRDPKWFHILPFEAEIRRQIWCVVTSLDILFSINEGLPLTIRAGEHDVRMPLNIEDADISPLNEQPPEPRPWELGTSSTYLLCHNKMVDVLCRILSGTFSLKPRPSYDTILSHDAELRATFASYPEYLRVPPESSNPLDPPHIIMQRFLLDLQFRKSLIVLHRPFAARVKENIKFKRSKEECMDASLQIIRRQNWLYHSPTAKSTLGLFGWFTDGLMLNHFFHACIMLCVELYTNMDSMSAFQRQTVREAVDASKEIHREIGRTDPSGAKKHGLIESLLDRYYEAEKMNPEQRSKLQVDLNLTRRFHAMQEDDEPALGVAEQVPLIESHSQVVRDSMIPSGIIHQMPMQPELAMQVDSDTFDVTFLPEEDEIYVDAPYRVRRLPDPSWLQQVYAHPQAIDPLALSPQKPAVTNNTGMFMNQMSDGGGGGVQIGSIEEGTPGSSSIHSSGSRAGSLAEGSAVVNVTTPTGVYSPGEGRMMSAASMMMMTQAPGTDIPQGMNWEEWDMFMQGIDMNPTTWNSISMGSVAPEPLNNHVVSVIAWDPAVQSELTPEPGLMDTSGGLEEQSQAASGIGGILNGIAFDSGF